MKRTTFIVFVLVLWLATCGPKPETPAPEAVPPTQAGIPATESTVHFDTLSATPSAPTEAAAPQGKLPAPPFPAKLYVSKTGGFAIDYPDGWTVSETVVGDRGSQIQFLTSPDLAEAATIPAGGTRITAEISQWDPKNDLTAYVQQRKTAWEASGFTVLEEQPMTLELGLSAMRFTVRTPETDVVYLITALPDHYLVFAGEGDLELAKQIIERVRPISQ